MKVLKICTYFFLYCAISACSNTAQVTSMSTGSEYYENTFTHTEFHTYQRNSIKKAASSDQALMVSLLNRPIPEDQKMMLAFAQRQNIYLQDSQFVGIQIKGEKADDIRTVSSYAHVIEKDINSVMINR